MSHVRISQKSKTCFKDWTQYFCMLFLYSSFSYILFSCKMDIVITGKLNDWTLFTYKNSFGLFSRKAEICQTWKTNAFYNSSMSSSAKSCCSYTITYILLFCIDISTKTDRGLWFNRTHVPLFQNMSSKIYTNFFLPSGD